MKRARPEDLLDRPAAEMVKAIERMPRQMQEQMLYTLGKWARSLSAELKRSHLSFGEVKHALSCRAAQVLAYELHSESTALVSNGNRSAGLAVRLLALDLGSKADSKSLSKQDEEKLERWIEEGETIYLASDEGRSKVNTAAIAADAEIARKYEFFRATLTQFD